MALKAQFVLDGSSSDSSGNGYNGTDTSISYVTGYQGQCASFNGSTSKIALPVAIMTGVTSGNGFTFAAWIKPTTNTGYAAVLDSTTSGGGSNRTCAIFLAGSTVWVAAGASGGTGVTPSTTFSAGSWQHLALTVLSTTIKLYRNGTQVATTTSGVSTTYATNNVLALGYNVSGGGAQYNGLIDDVRFYDTALTASDITTLYNSYSSSNYSSQQIIAAAAQA